MRPVLFDLDGTLVDSLPGLTAATNRLLGELDRPALATEQVRSLLGHGARALLAGAARLTGGPFSSDPYPRYVELCLDPLETLPFPGIEALLDRLAGRPLGVVTNKPEGPARALLDRLGWTDRFAVVVGADSLSTRKPDPAGLLHALSITGGTPEDAVYVGDSDVDVEVARRAGMPSIGVTWGYGDPRGADTVLDDVDRLAAVLGVSG